MAFGMTEQGFIPKRLSDILESLHDKIKNITDPETGEKPFVNETSDGILMQFADILSEELSICWEEAYMAANQYDPLNSSGAALRGLIQINGLTASYGSSTEIKMLLGGTPGVVIPQGSLIASQDGKEVYQTVSSATIGSGGSVEVNALSLEKGPQEPEVGSILSIQTPVFGWNSATNTETISVGSNADTDEQLHRKQERATSATSYRQVDAIFSGLINIPGVQFARVYLNKGTTTDSRGINPKTIAPVVVGGTNEDIARILSLKSGALDSFQGNTTVTYTGILGDTQEIKFTRPTEKDIYVDIDISFTDTSLYPEDGEEKIKQAIVDYAQYNKDGTAGFAPGDDVIRSRLYTPINSVLGFKINSLEIGTTSTTSEQDISIAWNEIAKFTKENIEITVTE